MVDAVDAVDVGSADWWALAHSPHVCRLDEALLMEARASRRLFGGARALLGRLRRAALAAGWARMAVAPTALAALALLRVRVPAPGMVLCRPADLSATLDALPLDSLSAARVHRPMLQALGCRHLGDLRRLPRGGVARRFGADLLQALDQAYGQAPLALDWITLPERFDQRLELPSPIESAGSLLFAARRLLRQLQDWLRGRHLGVVALRLGWMHDRLRGLDPAPGAIALRLAQPTQDAAHLSRLIAEHLERTPWTAAAVAVRLEVLQTQALATPATELFAPAASATQAQASLATLIERLSARLGPEQVLRGHCVPDHRPGQQQRWQPALDAQRQVRTPQSGPRPHGLRAHDLPSQASLQPPWLLEAPLPLGERGGRPVHQHETLELLQGPQRLETGWWDAPDHGAAEGVQSGLLRRDYFMARSARLGLLWVFRELPGPQAAAGRWFLHGFYG